MQNIQELLLLAPAILVAVTLHELAHGWVALKLGDPTAKNAGRLTLNPLPHIDPIGALMLFIAKIGWAKPVPINPSYFRHPLQDMAKVAAAGPLSNFLQALFASLILRSFPQLSATLLGGFFYLYFIINIGLCVFNLLPIPPLDGAKILPVFLNERQALAFYRFEQYGFLILILAFVLAPQLFNAIIAPPIHFLTRLLLPYSTL